MVDPSGESRCDHPEWRAEIKAQPFAGRDSAARAEPCQYQNGASRQAAQAPCLGGCCHETRGQGLALRKGPSRADLLHEIGRQIGGGPRCPQHHHAEPG